MGRVMSRIRAFRQRRAEKKAEEAKLLAVLERELAKEQERYYIYGDWWNYGDR